MNVQYIRVLSALTVIAFCILAGGSVDDSKSSSKSASSGSNCDRACDARTGDGPYFDKAYTDVYEPCLSEAVRKGISADANGCSSKASAYCRRICR